MTLSPFCESFTCTVIPVEGDLAKNSIFINLFQLSTKDIDISSKNANFAEIKI